MRGRRARVAIGIGAVGVAALAGCADAGPAIPVGRAPSSAGAPDRSVPLDPDAVVQEAGRLLRSARTLRVAGSGRDKDGPFRYITQYGTNGFAETYWDKDGKTSTTIVGSRIWVSTKELDGRWTEVSSRSEDGRDIAASATRAAALNPIAAALEGPGRVQQIGTGSVGRVRTAIYGDVADAGKPTSARPTFEVAVSSPHYLMRVGDPQRGDQSVMSFSNWNRPYRLYAPPPAKIVK